MIYIIPACIQHMVRIPDMRKKYPPTPIRSPISNLFHDNLRRFIMNSLSHHSPDLPAHCFATVDRHLNGQDPHPMSQNQSEVIVSGIFVTWESSTGILRGCIGCLSELPLSRLPEYAISSSQRDTRFSPIQLHELPDLTCIVSILHTMEPCISHKDWTIGLHGIVVEFSSNGRLHRSTFLPQVIPEQGWSQEEALIQACRKSGFRGDPSLLFSTMKVTRYQSTKTSLSYSEYISKYSSNKS